MKLYKYLLLGLMVLDDFSDDQTRKGIQVPLRICCSFCLCLGFISLHFRHQGMSRQRVDVCHATQYRATSVPVNRDQGTDSLPEKMMLEQRDVLLDVAALVAG